MIKKKIEDRIKYIENNSMYPAYGLNSQVEGLKQALEIIQEMTCENCKNKKCKRLICIDRNNAWSLKDIFYCSEWEEK